MPQHQLSELAELRARQQELVLALEQSERRAALLRKQKERLASRSLQEKASPVRAAV